MAKRASSRPLYDQTREVEGPTAHERADFGVQCVPFDNVQLPPDILRRALGARSSPRDRGNRVRRDVNLGFPKSVNRSLRRGHDSRAKTMLVSKILRLVLPNTCVHGHVASQRPGRLLARAIFQDSTPHNAAVGVGGCIDTPGFKDACH